LGEQLLRREQRFAQAWNFGPSPDCNKEVIEVLVAMRKYWPKVSWDIADTQELHESKLLQLDSSKARAELRWRPVWDFEKMIQKTAEWYQAWIQFDKVLSNDQLLDYINDAKLAGLRWANS
jgi:CDP-glucose 4,6-dehydratase